jgi:dTDP-glucose 4,6-dehydratase
MNRILVIGSNSFSGASFVEHVLSSSIDVLGVSRSKEPAGCFLPYRWDGRQRASGSAQAPRGNFNFVQADLNKDLDATVDAADEFRPDCVVNFSAQGMVAQSWENPLHWFQTNVMANVALSDRLRKATWLHRYIHVSTPEVYGSCSGTVMEDAPFNPSTPYAASRAACDLHLRTYFRQHAFPVLWTRSANVYGPGQQLYRIIPRAILCIKTGSKLQLHGGGHSVRSFIHIRDVAAATLAVALRGTPGETYHLSTALHLSIRAVVERICARMGVAFEDAVEIVDDRPGKDAAYLLDSTKARTELGWTDTVSLDEGIDECIQWMDRDFEEILRQPLDYIHKP